MAQLIYEELLTVLTEVEGVLNSRPLTYVYSDITDQEPLTPGHLTWSLEDELLHYQTPLS